MKYLGANVHIFLLNTKATVKPQENSKQQNTHNNLYINTLIHLLLQIEIILHIYTTTKQF